jgi:hypothetical protein
MSFYVGADLLTVIEINMIGKMPCGYVTLWTIAVSIRL